MNLAVDTVCTVHFRIEKFGSMCVKVYPPARHVDGFLLDVVQYFQTLPDVDKDSVYFEYIKSLRKYEV